MPSGIYVRTEENNEINRQSHHFDNNGNLCEDDVKRQQEIQKHFPEYEFFRIKET